MVSWRPQFQRPSCPSCISLAAFIDSPADHHTALPPHNGLAPTEQPSSSSHTHHNGGTDTAKASTTAHGLAQNGTGRPILMLTSPTPPSSRCSNRSAGAEAKLTRMTNGPGSAGSIAPPSVDRSRLSVVDPRKARRRRRSDSPRETPMQEETTRPVQGEQSGAPPSHSTTSTPASNLTHSASSSATPANMPPSPTAMSPFPAEVLELVLEYLPRRHLVKCVRVNSFFYNVAIKHLYRTVVLGSTGPWPTLVGPHKGRSTNPGRKTQSHNARVRGAQLVKYIRVVEVKPHHVNLCQVVLSQRDPGTSESPPALQVVRVTLPDIVGTHQLHTDGRLHTCSSTRDLCPTTFVVRNAPFAFSDIPEDVLTICNHHASRFVYVVTPDQTSPVHYGLSQVWPDESCGLYGLLQSLPPATTELVVVFHTPGPNLYWRTQPPLHLPLNRGEEVDVSEWPNLATKIDHDLLELVAHLEMTWLRSMVWQIAKMVGSFRPEDSDWRRPLANKRITLVNTNSLGPASWCPSETFRYDTQTVLYWYLYNAVYTADEDEMERRLDRVTFLTMEEYFEGEDWFGVFEPEEAAPWMNQTNTTEA